MKKVIDRLRSSSLACVFTVAWASAAYGQSNITLPDEFESAGSELGRLFSYFGGVASYSTATDPGTVFSGSSCRVTINFRHDNIFRIAGVGIGTLGIDRPAVAVPSAADTFSVTIQSPPQGTLSVKVTVREDDNADGLIDAGADDDQWETASLLLQSGTNVYNFSFAGFTDVNPGTGNDAQNFATVNRMAYFLTFETRAVYPGGMIEVPVSFLIDHVGFYVGSQVIPSPVCEADFNADTFVDSQDFFDFLAAFFELLPASDFNHDAVVNSQDFFDFLAAFFAGC